MRAEQHLQEIARSRGWSDSIQLLHALTFIDQLVTSRVISADDFGTYLDQIRAEEKDVARRIEDVGT